MTNIDPTTADHAARVVLAILDGDSTAFTTALADVATAPAIGGIDPVTRLVGVIANDLAMVLVELHDGDRDAVRERIRAGILARAK